jgi:hypothetical protein
MNIADDESSGDVDVVAGGMSDLSLQAQGRGPWAFGYLHHSGAAAAAAAAAVRLLNPSISPAIFQAPVPSDCFALMPVIYLRIDPTCLLENGRK